MTNLCEKMKQEMILRGLSSGTQEQYLRAVRGLRDHYQRPPSALTEEEVKTYLLLVISNNKIADSTYNVMIHGLNFFYETVLGKKIVEMNLPRKKQAQTLSDILSTEEVKRLIMATPNLKHRTILIVTYGAGLRSCEVGPLTVKDIDRDRGLIHIRSGKGKKDRYVILSPFMLSTLELYWRSCRSKALRRTSPSSSKNKQMCLLP